MQVMGSNWKWLSAALLAATTVLLAAAMAWATGELAQKPGAAGCVSELGIGGCQSGRGLAEDRQIAISPDGKNAYVAGFASNAVAIFDRDPSSGALTQKAGSAGCISEDGTDRRGETCQVGRALGRPDGVTVSPDGRFVYVASFASNAVAELRRDTTTGALSPAGCIALNGNDQFGNACEEAKGVEGASAIDLSPDGKNAYVASFASNSVTIFDRNPVSGSLTQKAATAGCIANTASIDCQDGRGLFSAADVTVSPDGTSVYVAAQNNGVAIFKRDPATGALTQAQDITGCFSDGTDPECQKGRGVDHPRSVIVSPDGEYVYFASIGTDAVSIFKRDAATAALTQKAGSAGCISETGGEGCADGTALEGAAAVTLSPDGKQLYAAAANSNAVAIFDRDPATGTLQQKSGTAGCVSADGTGGACQEGRALEAPFGIVLSPDGKNVYVAAARFGAIAIFDQATHTTVPPPADTRAPTVSGFRLAPSRFKIASKRGSHFQFTLSEPATARIEIERARSGRRVGKRCQPATAKLAKRPSCTRFVHVASLPSATLTAGAGAIAFTGRIGPRPLTPGAYQATIVATDGAGNASAPAQAKFTILAPRPRPHR